MTSSDERREVAERMRALPSDIYSTIKEWADRIRKLEAKEGER